VCKSDIIDLMNQLHRISTDIGEIEIVQAQLSDGDDVVAILEEAAQWLSDRGIIEQWEPGSFIAHRSRIDQNIIEGQVYLAKLGDQLVGTLTIQWSDRETWGDVPDNAGYVHRLAVRRQYAGHDIGSHLLEWAEKIVASEGRAFLRLDCWSGNAALCQYYERCGFTNRGLTNFGEGDWYATLFEKETRQE